MLLLHFYDVNRPKEVSADGLFGSNFADGDDGEGAHTS